MAVRIVEWQLPYSAGTWINITANKVIEILLRSENNLIEVDDNNELYVDLQLASWITPTDDFPVWVTVWQVLSSDGWITSWTLLNFQTTSWDYGRWLYGTDGHMYYDHWTWTFTQIYSSTEVDALFTQLRSELATVAFTWDYNDLLNRPVIPVIWDWTLTINQNNVSKWAFTANQIWPSTIDLTDTTYPNMTAWEVWTWTDTTPMVISPKVLSDYVLWKVSSVYKYQWSVQDYDHLPTQNLTVWDVYNVIDAHTTAPIFDAWTNVAWTGTARDPLGWNVDLSNYVTINWNETITWTKTFTTDPVLPSKTTDATNTWTSPATEAQVYKKQDTLVSWTNIKTINTTSLLWSWDISVQETLVSWTNIKTVNNTTILWSWNIDTNQVSDVAYDSSWDWVISIAPSKNAVYDKIESLSWAIPTVNDGTISFTQWWVAKWDFTTNQASAETIALEWNILTTQTDYDNLPSSKLTDNNFYIIYSS